MFPRLTKCGFSFFAGNGMHYDIDAICVISLNIVHEKIFIVLWFWVVIMAMGFAIHVVIRVREALNSVC